jgi:hypothetical protein
MNVIDRIGGSFVVTHSLINSMARHSSQYSVLLNGVFADNCVAFDSIRGCTQSIYLLKYHVPQPTMDSSNSHRQLPKTCDLPPHPTKLFLFCSLKLLHDIYLFDWLIFNDTSRQAGVEVTMFSSRLSSIR